MSEDVNHSDFLDGEESHVDSLRARLRILEADLAAYKEQHKTDWERIKTLRADLKRAKEVFEKIMAHSLPAGYDSGDSGIVQICRDVLRELWGRRNDAD